MASGAKTDVGNRQGDTPTTLARHIGPKEGDSPDMKGNTDEATHNFIKNNVYTILISAKLCSAPNGKDGCVGKRFLTCMQHNTLRCDMYGIDDEKIIKELVQAFQESGLRVSGVSFWRSSEQKKSILEKPILEYGGNL